MHKSSWCTDNNRNISVCVHISAVFRPHKSVCNVRNIAFKYMPRNLEREASKVVYKILGSPLYSIMVFREITSQTKIPLLWKETQCTEVKRVYYNKKIISKIIFTIKINYCFPEIFLYKKKVPFTFCQLYETQSIICCDYTNVRSRGWYNAHYRAL